MEENKEKKHEERKEIAEAKKEEKMEEKLQEKVEKIEEKTEEEKKEIKQEEKKEEKEKEKKPAKKQEIVKKDKAIARGINLRISKKHSMAICDMIRGRKIEEAVKELEQIAKLRKAVPMKGEIPHRKGMSGGRYPVNAAKEFIRLLKLLNANSNVNGVEEPIITFAMANKAGIQRRRGGSEEFKRTNVLLEARELSYVKKMKREKKK